MQKDLLDHGGGGGGGGGGHMSKNICLFPISLIGEMAFSTQIYNLLLVLP